MLSTEQRAEAARRVDTQKIPQLLNLANQAQANASSEHRAQARGATVPPSATQPVPPLTISFSQDEINASLWKWSEQYKADYERYVSNPFVSLQEGAIVLMATAPEFGRVASAHFEPRLDDAGMLRCDLASLKVGSLPLPEGLLSKQREKVEGALRSKLPAWQNKANIDPTGLANLDAKAAALGKMVLRMLNHEPSPAVVFLPRDEKLSKTVPVRLTNGAVEKGLLTITVQPMDAAERAALLDQIRQPHQSALANVPKS
jgi:hypothetical protein